VTAVLHGHYHHDHDLAGAGHEGTNAEVEIVYAGGCYSQ
jgi:hypothetical protein